MCEEIQQEVSQCLSFWPAIDCDCSSAALDRIWRIELWTKSYPFRLKPVLWELSRWKISWRVSCRCVTTLLLCTIFLYMVLCISIDISFLCHRDLIGSSLAVQEKIYDEQDIRDRDRAVSILTRWAATKLQDFYRRKKKQRQSSLSPSSRKKATADAAVVAAALSESTPLLSSISETNHRTTTVNNHNGSIV